MSQLICYSKNSITSQSKQHDIHSVLIMNEACDSSAARMQLCSLILFAVWYHSQFDIVDEFDIICSLILCVIWYCLHSFILFFLFNLNCASTSLYILKLEHALLILYFLSLYSHQEWWHFFKRDICYRYSAVTASS